MNDDAMLTVEIAAGCLPRNIRDVVDSLIGYKITPVYCRKDGAATGAKRNLPIRKCQECGRPTENGFMCAKCRGYVKYGRRAYK